MKQITLPLALVISLISSAVGAGSVAAVAKAKLDETAEDVAHLKAERETHALRLQAIEMELRYVTAALVRIERKLGTR